VAVVGGLGQRRPPREQAVLPRPDACRELHLEDDGPRAEPVVAKPPRDRLGVRDDGGADAPVVARVAVERALLAVGARVAVGVDDSRVLPPGEAREMLGGVPDDGAERGGRGTRHGRRPSGYPPARGWPA
jgi:hypothetical protein